ncbi:VOC family protein [Nocardioides marinquilinus]|uniref:VOC family protein n=1 Tax=Nocardioides marinquilinus TaxID=1210400 RepID=A0ABP9PLQ3_9ACTN
MEVSPWIVAADAEGLLAFLAEVFGAEEAGRVPGPDGGIGHAETRLGASTVVVMDAHDGWTPHPSLLRVAVDDVAGVVRRAEAAGARVVTPRTSLPFGDDVARVADPWGNLWWVHQHVEDVGFDELLRRMDDPASSETMAGFELSLDAEMRRRTGGTEQP